MLRTSSRLTKVDAEGKLGRWEIYRFYADLSIVIAYAYTLFQVAPVAKDARIDIVWLLIGYPIIVGLYAVENWLRVRSYGPIARRTIPLAVTFVAHLLVAAIYIIARHKLRHSPHAADDLLWLNGVTLPTAIAVMWGYRHFNKWYKNHYVLVGS